METLYTGHIHGFPAAQSKSDSVGSSSSIWDEQSGLVALGVVLGSSVSLVGLAFAFITYSLFSDLRSLAGTALLSFLASLFMGQLFFVIGVGGIQDDDLCLSLSMAQMFMKLASLAWLCCCCHHALDVFRTSNNLVPVPETNMGKSLAHYSVLSWGFPLLMVAVALAFKYSTTEGYDGYPLTRLEIVHATATVAKKATAFTATTSANGQVSRHNISSVSYAERHCWLMEGPAYLWGFLIPGSVLLLLGLWLAFQASDAVKFSASLQVDSRTRNKLLKRRGLQIGLFIKLLILLAFVLVMGAMASLWALPELWALYSIIQGAQGILTAFLVTCNCRVLKLYTVPRHKQTQKYVQKNGCYKSLRDCEKGQYGVLSITNPNYDGSTEDDRHQQQQTGLSEDEDVDIFRSDSLAVQHPLKVWHSSKSQQGVPEDSPAPNPNFLLEGGHEKRMESVLAGRSECDKSSSGRRNFEEQQGVENRILTPAMNKSNEGDTLGEESAALAVDGATTSGGIAGSVGGNKKSIQPLLPASHGKLSGALSMSELPRRPLPSAV